MRARQGTDAGWLIAALFALLAIAAVAFAADVDLTAETALLVKGGASGDRAGAAVAPAGDVNGDGKADFIVGAPGRQGSGGALQGSAYVIFGPLGDSPLELAALGTRGFRIDGAGAFYGAGTDVAGIGDVNKDGKDDLLIGAPHVEPRDTDPSDRLPGIAYVVYGQSSTDTVDLAKVGDTVPGLALKGIADADDVGQAVAGLGDVNGDALPDLAVGAGGVLGNGQVIVLFGSGTTDTKQLNISDIGTAGFKITGANLSVLGNDVAGPGDVDGDGKADILVGAPGESSQAGAAYLVHGKATTSAVDVTVSGSALRMAGEAASDLAGMHVGAPGDVDGDGKADMLVGAPMADPQRRPDAGTAYVVFGRTGTEAVSLGSLGTGGYPIEGPADGAQIGPLAGAGDAVGDEVRDILVGQATATSVEHPNTGAVWVVPGHKTSDKTDLASAPEGTLRLVGGDEEKTGGAVASAELDASGRPEVLAGAPDAGGGLVRVRLGGGGSATPTPTVTPTVTPTATPSPVATAEPTPTPILVGPLTTPVIDMDDPTPGSGATPITGTVVAPGGLAKITVTVKPAGGSATGPIELPITCITCGGDPSVQEPIPATMDIGTAPPVYKVGPVNVNIPPGGYDLDYAAVPTSGLGIEKKHLNVGALPPLNTSQGNLWISGFELNQAIQVTSGFLKRDSTKRHAGPAPVLTYPSAIPLIVGKPTIARLFVRGEKFGPNNNDYKAKVFAQLHAYQGGVEMPGSPITPMEVFKTSTFRGPVESQRLTAEDNPFLSGNVPLDDDSFWFVLPVDWTGPLPVRIKAEVFAAGDFKECHGCQDGANVLETKVGYKHTQRIFIDYWGFRVGGKYADGNNVFDVLRNVFPIAPDDVIVRGKSDGSPRGPIEISSYDTEEAYDELPAPDEERFASYNYDGDEQLSSFGIVPYVSGASTGPNGIGEMVPIGHGNNAVAFDRSSKGTVTAQEIGHNLDRNHSSCDHNESDGETILFPCDSTEETGIEHGFIDGLGIDTLYWSVIRGVDWGKPNTHTDLYHSHDFMNYGGHRWVNSYTYKGLYDEIKGGVNIPASAARARAAAKRPAPRAALELSGVVAADGTLTLRRMRPTRARIATAGGAYVAVLLGAAGTELARVDFDGSVSPHGFREQPFRVAVPDVAGLARIELRSRAGALLGARDAGPVPSVSVSTKASAGLSAVRFSASGTNDPAAVAWLEYSHDGGRTWAALSSAPAAAGVLAFDGASIAEAKGARLRVVVVSGLRYAAKVLAGTLRAPNHAPSVAISRPFENYVFGTGVPVALVATGSDLEDGALARGRVTWRSDRDGVLGTGTSLSTGTLSIGRHTITVTARDAAGKASRPATVHVRIMPSILRVAGLPQPETVKPTAKLARGRAGRRGPTLVFSEPIAGLGSRHLVLKAGGRAVPFTIVAGKDAAQVRLRPVGRARGRGTLAVAGLTDRQGNTLTAKRFTFKW